jgi:deoxyribodipyrimidine photolyase-related protein
MFDPMDHLFMKRIKMNKNVSVTMLDSPQFLLTNQDVQDYASRHEGKRLQHAPFFAFVKEKLGILVDVPSMDANNRRPFPKKNELPPQPFVATNSTQKRWQEQQQWIQAHPIFSKNPGSIEDIGYPYTFEDVRAWFQKFLRERFSLFGTYEDAVVAESPWMYHSGIAVFLNMGLLTPKYVIDTLHNPKYRALTKQINNYEGFLRQLMGWREYARLYYVSVPSSIYLRNIFGMKKQRLPNDWYVKDLSTGNKFIDDTIQDAWNTGYLHHIRRLMVISNYMTLSEIHPDRVFDWMYEFSMDSWDWVMVFNVYSMGTWSDGGYAMRKPYISSSSYLKKMANLKNREDSYIWDEKFKRFLQKHKDILKHTQLAKLVKSL